MKEWPCGIIHIAELRWPSRDRSSCFEQLSLSSWLGPIIFLGDGDSKLCKNFLHSDKMGGWDGVGAVK